MAEIHQAQKQIEPLLKEAQKRGKPEENRPKALKIRQGLQGRLEALLSDAQRRQWKEMLGKPIERDSLFD